MNRLYSVLDRAEKSKDTAIKTIASLVRTDIDLYTSATKMANMSRTNRAEKLSINPFYGYDMAIINKEESGYTHRISPDENFFAAFEAKIRILRRINTNVETLEILLGE